MNKSISLLVFLAFISCSPLIAQQYTAAGYWRMERDTGYTRLLQRQTAGIQLTEQEQSLIADHKTRLAEYFEKMPDSEKSLYYKYRAQWTSAPDQVSKIVVQQEADVYSGERSMYTQYLIASGLFGFLYGGAAAYVMGFDGEAAIAIPFLAAGISTLVPMLSIKDKNVSYNSLALSNHGKAIGALQGAAFGFLLTGDNVDEGKFIVGMATLSSIALGRVGYTFGRDKPWSTGRVALYSHYGFLMPLEGLAIDAALQIEDPRIYAATSLVFGAGGYLIADRISLRHDYTLGDVISTQALAGMNGLLGVCIMSEFGDESEISPAEVLIPAAGFLGGTILGHIWTRDTRLSQQQGRNTALASAGGVVIGLGLTALVSPESATPYYLVSYATGMGAYAWLVTKYKKSNKLIFNEPDKGNRWSLNLMPQNILINKKIASGVNFNPGKRTSFLPAFSASLTF